MYYYLATLTKRRPKQLTFRIVWMSFSLLAV